MIYSNRLKQQHVLRGLAAFYVLVYHARFGIWSGGSAFLDQHPVSRFSLIDFLMFGIVVLTVSGKQAVIIFFVLSGFFISYTYDKNPLTAPRFYLNRLIRIYPPYLFSIAGSVFILLLVHRLNPSLFFSSPELEYNTRLLNAYNQCTFSNFMKSLFFTSDGEFIGFNQAYWSLLPEGVFYLLFPIIYARLQNKFILFLLMVLSFFGSLIIIPNLLYYHTFFIAGVLFYRLYSKGQLPAVKRYIFWLLLVVLFLLMIAVEGYHYEKLADIIALLVAVVSIILLNEFTFNSRLVKVTIGLGNISFSLYLIHFPVLLLTYCLFSMLYNQVVIYNWLPFITGIVAALLASILLYYLVEYQSLKLLRSLNLRKKTKEDN